MFQTAFANLNWLHVLVATLAYFILGALWYGALFSKPWTSGHKIDTTNPDVKKGAGAIMAMSFVAFFVITIFSAIVLQLAVATTAMHAVKWGLFMGLGIAAPVITINHLYLQKPIVVHLIDGLYHVLGLIAACVVLVLWK